MNFLKKPLFFLLFSILFVFQSCNNENISSITEIVLNSSNTTLLVDDTFTFTTTANNSSDITAESDFYVNNQLIVGNSFTPSTAGTYIVSSKYNNINSNFIEIKASNPTGYTQKVLVEDYTGTWCGNCPRISYAIDQLTMQTDRVIPVGVHLFANNDPYFFSGCQVLYEEFEISGLPEGRLNRTIRWANPEPDNLNQVLNLTGDSAVIGLAINSELNNNTIDLDIRVGFAQDFTESLGIVVYLVEDGLIYFQTNYTFLYPGGNVDIEDFEHNHVLRAIYTNHLGESIPQNETVENNTYTFTIQNEIPNTVEDINQLSIIAFIVNADTKEVINTQTVKVGENQPFD